MIVVREIFVAKPGMASKLAKMFKEQMGEVGGSNTKIMTDVVGPYNTVVMETEYKSLTHFSEEMEKYMEKSKKEEKPSGPSHTEMYIEGRREIFRVW